MKKIASNLNNCKYKKKRFDHIFYSKIATAVHIATTFFLLLIRENNIVKWCFRKKKEKPKFTYYQIFEKYIFIKTIKRFIQRNNTCTILESVYILILDDYDGAFHE